MTLSKPLELTGKPVVRVENMCATGAESLRQAAYAVACGAYDVAAAVGVEKAKDSGYQGLNAFPIPNDGSARTLTAAAMFSMAVPAYAKKYSVDPVEMKRVLAEIGSKNHANGVRNERGGVPQARLGRRDHRHAHGGRGAHGDGLCRGGRRCRRGHRRPGRGCAPLHGSPRSTSRRSRRWRATARASATRATTTPPFASQPTAPARRTRKRASPIPRRELAMAQVHDCFTITELILCEDLGFAERGTAWKDVLSGAFALDGELPVNTDGGLKSFGHPVGASGLRMIFECWLQLRHEAGARQSRHRTWPGAHPQPRWLPGRNGLVHHGARRPARLTGERPPPPVMATIAEVLRLDVHDRWRSSRSIDPRSATPSTQP